MKAFICLGSEAEVIGILPIVQHEFETTGEKPTLIVSKTDIPNDLPFANTMLHFGNVYDMLPSAKRVYGDVVVFPCLTDTDFPTEHRHPSHQLDQWDRAGVLHLWNKLPLTLPMPAMEQWPFKAVPAANNPRGLVAPFKSLPFILLADDDPFRPFPFRDELFALLVENFPLHQIVRLSEIRTTHLFDVLPLYGAADLIVCAETVHLQLSRACKTPVIALVNDQPTLWHGSALSERFSFYVPYSRFQEFKKELIAVAKEAIWPAGEKDVPPSVAVIPSVTMVYIYVPNDEQYDKAAKRFVASYLKFPPGITHRTMIVCQCRRPVGTTLECFMQLPNVSFYVHNNSGWDIGAFITVSRIIAEDMMVCFGSSAHFRQEGWMKRMVEVWNDHGPGFYGSLSSYEISPHMNTSGFWCAPKLLAEYPLRVQTKAQRYDFEFGKNAMWKWCAKNRVTVMLATWDGVYEWPYWRERPNIYRRGDQSNCLTFFHHNDNFDGASAETREKMSRFADNLTDKQYIEVETRIPAVNPQKATMNPPKVVVVYVYPTLGGKHDEMAARFADTYEKYPADEPHELWVVSNGGEPTLTMRATFFGIPCNYLVHDDTGLDIGAYRKAAREIPCDLMVFFGGNTYLVRRGWLRRMVEAYQKHGMAIYGATGSLGHNIHIRTTGFWMPPSLLNAYPYPVTSETASRYEFEHGKKGLTGWVMARGLKALMVTWTGEFQWREWDGIPNGFQRGDQSALLVGDRLTQPEYQRPAGPKQAIVQARPPNPAVQRPPRPATQPQRRQAIIKKR